MMSKLGALHLTKHTGTKHSATVIFFHGSGSSGSDMKKWVYLMEKTFSFPHIRILFPTAPLQPYSVANNEMSNVWFDRAGISPDVPEQIDSLSKIEVEVKKLIKTEKDLGITTDRIIVGGFSMGGSLSFHVGLRWEKNLAGTFVFSSFLNNGSIVYQELKNNPGAKIPPLLQFHGENDELVPANWGEATFEQLKQLGVQGEFHRLPTLGHAINRPGILILKKWIEKHLPNIPDESTLPTLSV